MRNATDERALSRIVEALFAFDSEDEEVRSFRTHHALCIHEQAVRAAERPVLRRAGVGNAPVLEMRIRVVRLRRQTTADDLVSKGAARS